MATTLWLANTNHAVTGLVRGDRPNRKEGVASAWTTCVLALSLPGTAAADLLVSSVTGPTNGIEAGFGHTGAAEWLSPPLAAAVTISGTITCNIQAYQSAMTTNAAVNVIVEKYAAADQSLTQIGISANTVELGTAFSNNNFTITPTSTAFAVGDRIRIRIFFDDSVAATMASGSGNLHIGANATGSTIVFTENFTWLTTEPSGTQLFLTDTAGPAVGANVEKEMWTSRGSTAVESITNSAAGPLSPIQATVTGGGTAIEWYTKPLSTFTLNGLVRLNIRAHELPTVSGNIALRAELAVCNGDGSSPVVWAVAGIHDVTAPPNSGTSGPGTQDFGGELTAAQAAVRSYLAGNSVTVTEGQRLRLRLYLDDPAFTSPIAGYTMRVTYGGPTAAASGDSWITLPQTVTEAVPSLGPPDTIAGKVAWLDASDATTIASSGGSVTAWTDKFFGRVFSQAGTTPPVTGANTLNGKNVLTFSPAASGSVLTYDAGSDAIDLSPFTIFAVVYDARSGAGYSRLVSTRKSGSGSWDYQSPNTIPLVRQNANRMGTYSNGVSMADDQTPTVPINEWHILRGKANGSLVGTSVDTLQEPTQTGATDAANQRYIRIGDSCHATSNPPDQGAVEDRWSGRVAEIIIYNKELTAAETAKIEGYLATKWKVGVPNQITGLGVWLDSSDPESITASAGAVSQWSDKSGNARHFVQATAGAKPTTDSATIGGLNALSFDGGDDVLFDAGSDSIDLSPWTCFIVFQDDSAGTSYRRLMSARLAATGQPDYGSGNAVLMQRNSGAAIIAVSNAANSWQKAYNTSVPVIGRTQHDVAGTSLQAAVDGAPEVTYGPVGSPSNLRYLRIGGSCANTGTPPDPNGAEGWQGKIAEVILYQASLSVADKQKIEQYLYNKWGIPFQPHLQITAAHSFWADDTAFRTGLANGAAVTAWRNHSGGGDLSAPGADPTFVTSHASLNNRGAVKIDSSQNQYMDVNPADIIQPFKYIIVMKAEYTNFGTLIGFPATKVHINGSSQWEIDHGTAVAGGSVNALGHVLKGIASGASSALWVDTAAVISGNAGTGGITELKVGVNTSGGNVDYYNGYIAFIGIYPGTTPDSVLDDLVADLMTYYAIAAPPITRGLSESIGLLDASADIQTLGRVLPEPVGIIDTPSRLQVMGRALPDLLGLLDTPAQLFASARLLPDNPGLLDAMSQSLTSSQNFVQTVPESMGLLDAATELSLMAQVITERLILDDNNYVYLPGSNTASWINTPSDAGVGFLSTDMEGETWIAVMDSFTGAGIHLLVSKIDTLNTALGGWYLGINTTGTLRLLWGDGAVNAAANSTVTLQTMVELGQPFGIKWTLVKNNGSSVWEVKYWINRAGTWEQLGATVTGGVVAVIAAVSYAVRQGCDLYGNNGGRVIRHYAFKLRAGVGGSLIRDMDFTKLQSFPVSPAAVLDNLGNNFTFGTADVMGLRLSQQLATVKAVTDPEGLVDAATKVSPAVRSQTDAEGLVDAAASLSATLASITDAEGLVDTPSSVSQAYRVISEALGVVDAASTSAPQVPEMFAGLAVWLDASQLGLADGASVDPWPNLGSDLDPTTVGTPPTFHTNQLAGKPVVRLVAGQGRYRLTMSEYIDLNWTVIYVGRITNPSSLGRLVGAIYTPANMLVGYWNGFENIAYVEGFLTPDARYGQTTNWNLFTGTGEGVPGDAKAWFYKDGIFQSGNHAVTGGIKGTLAIGGFDPTTGGEVPDSEIAELVVYNRRLSDVERNTVEDYLRAKWLPPATLVSQTDAIGLQDSLFFTLASLRPITDPIGLVDTPSQALAAQRPFTDPVNLVDAATDVAATTRSQTDAEGIVDSVIDDAGALFTFTDPEGIVDTPTQVSAIQRPQTDAEGLIDAATKDLAATRSVTDAEVLNDLMSQQLFIMVARQQDDMLGLVDASSLQVNYQRPQVDAEGLVDTITIQAAIQRLQTDAENLFDSTSKDTVTLRAVTDAENLADSQPFTVASVVNFAELMGLTDTQDLQQNHVRFVIDQEGLIEALGFVNVTATVFMVYRPTGWVASYLGRWDGDGWVPMVVERWNGTEWVVS